MEIVRPHEDFIIGHLPRACETTNLGDPRGATAQYRCPQNLHVRNYPDRLVAHYDLVDPRQDCIGHLVYDSPELLAVGVGLGGGLATRSPGLGILLGLAIYVLARLARKQRFGF